MNRTGRLWRIAAPLALLCAPAWGCEVRVEPDQLYAEGQMELGLKMPLKVDAYRPVACTVGLAARVPPIILFPGGGFGDRVAARHAPAIQEIADALARAGFVVFVAEHRPRVWHGVASVSETKTKDELDELRRRAAQGPYPPDSAVQGLIAAEDAFKLRRWIVSQAATYQLHTGRFGIIGPSSGAATALTTEYMGDDLGLGEADMRAVVDLWGDFYPHTDLEAGEAPLLVVIGTADALVDYAQTTDLMARAAEVGVEASRISMPGVGHGLPAADIFHRRLRGSELTVFDVIVRFFRAKLLPRSGESWPPEGQGREMVTDRLGG